MPCLPLFLPPVSIKITQEVVSLELLGHLKTFTFYLKIEGGCLPSDLLVQSWHQFVVKTLRTRFWTWLLLVSGGTPSSAARPFPPAGPPAPPRAAVARRRGIFPESDLEKQNQTLGWIWSTLSAGFHSIFDFKASHRSVPPKLMVSKFAPTSLRNSR